MKASDIIKKKGKNDGKGKKPGKNSLIDWIGKRRQAGKATAPKKAKQHAGDEDDDDEY
jgi:hypothetical protein